MPRAKSNRDRYPSGKLKPEIAPPTLIRRMINAARRDASNALLGSELGRLRLNGVLTDRQVAAGQKFGELVGAYDRVKGLPSRHPKSPAWERGYGKSTRADMDQAVIDVTLRRYDVAAGLLLAEGFGVRRITIAATVYDDIVPFAEQPLLIRGLDRLVVHFCLERG